MSKYKTGNVHSRKGFHYKVCGYDGFDDTHFFVVSLAVWAQHDRFDDTRVVWCCLRRGQISKQNNMMDLTVLVLFGVAYCVASFQNKNHDRFDGVWC